MVTRIQDMGLSGQKAKGRIKFKRERTVLGSVGMKFSLNIFSHGKVSGSQATQAYQDTQFESMNDTEALILSLIINGGK